MQYGTECGTDIKDLGLINVQGGEVCNENYMRYVGYPKSTTHQDSWLFKPSTINMISKKITQLLQGVDSTGRDIVVTNRVICGVLSSLIEKQLPINIGGDIYTIDNIPLGVDRNDLAAYTNMAISVIVNEIRNEYGMTECNKKLSIWDSVYGEFNEKGLRAHPPLKIRNKTPQKMMFNMNY